MKQATKKSQPSSASTHTKPIDDGKKSQKIEKDMLEHQEELNWRGLVRTPLRQYQVKICSSACKQNSIVVLPTGSGKTLIAATLAQWHRNHNKEVETGNGKTLFLVPTIMLVKQQSHAVESNTGLRVAQFHGELKWPTQEYDVLVSTPASFKKKIGELKISFTMFSLVIFDEVHHVVKQHPYKKLAKLLQICAPKPRILGLTATCTYAVDGGKIGDEIINLCQELGVTALLSATTEELIRDGYHGATPDLTKHFESSSSDKGERKMEEEEEKEESDSDDEKPEVLSVFGDVNDIITNGTAKFPPHQSKEAFFYSIESGEASPLLLRTMALTREIEKRIAARIPFSSPMEAKGKKGKVSEWAVYASKLNNPLASILMHLYEALRLMVISWSTAPDLMSEYLKMTLLHKEYIDLMGDLAVEFNAILKEGSSPKYLERFDRLERVLLDQLKIHGKNFRGILFVQQKLTTHILKHFIDHNDQLSPKLRCDCIYATSSECNPSFRVTPTQSRERVSGFASGDLNLLIATMVAEEGMDIPAANCIIRFDPIQTPVSLVQGRGRARQEKSTFVVMGEMEGRSLEELSHAEKHQMDLLHTHSKALIETAHSDQALRKKRMADENRESSAKKYLENATGNPISIIKTFCMKLGCEALESFSKEGGGVKAIVSVHMMKGMFESQVVGKSKQEAKFGA
eukprot:TRINITY_DN8016_c0_g1_i1.p1 TRINITY_DN8016_c0_g1~~TRINITY_DN8016_c0_g1_i1.p1  ORF type:complete len:687 (+),score=123.64 TRINITY_DN8016_c0_g1_i1:101-2161(+)